MARRHNIAHHGDHDRAGGGPGELRVNEPLATIEPADVDAWEATAVRFTLRVCDALRSAPTGADDADDT